MLKSNPTSKVMRMSTGLHLRKVGRPTFHPTFPDHDGQVHPPHGVDCPILGRRVGGMNSPLGFPPSFPPFSALWTPRASGPLLAALVRVSQKRISRCPVHKTSPRSRGFTSLVRVQICKNIANNELFQAIFALMVLSPDFQKVPLSEMQSWRGSSSNESRIFDNADYETRVTPCQMRTQVSVFNDDKPFCLLMPEVNRKSGASRNMHRLHTTLRGSFDA